MRFPESVTTLYPTTPLTLALTNRHDHRPDLKNFFIFCFLSSFFHSASFSAAALCAFFVSSFFCDSSSDADAFRAYLCVGGRGV